MMQSLSNILLPTPHPPTHKTATELCHRYLQYVEKTWSSVPKFKHEDYKSLASQVLAYPVVKPLSSVM